MEEFIRIFFSGTSSQGLALIYVMYCTGTENIDERKFKRQKDLWFFTVANTGLVVAAGAMQNPVCISPTVNSLPTIHLIISTLQMQKHFSLTAAAKRGTRIHMEFTGSLSPPFFTLKYTENLKY